MAKDDRDVLEVLKSELDFIDKGGYGRSVRTPWKATSVFQDSPTCLNFCDPNRSHPCSECLLMEFVPPEHRSQGVPCHRIPLSRHGQTIESLELAGNQDDQEEAVKTWLRSTISRIEQVREQLAAAQRRDCEKQASSSGRKRILVVGGWRIHRF